jgi:hypothetical protein
MKHLDEMVTVFDLRQKYGPKLKTQADASSRLSFMERHLRVKGIRDTLLRWVSREAQNKIELN